MSTSGIGPISNFDFWRNDKRETPMPDAVENAELRVEQALKKAIAEVNSGLHPDYYIEPPYVTSYVDNDGPVVDVELNIPVYADEGVVRELGARLVNLGQRLVGK